MVALFSTSTIIASEMSSIKDLPLKCTPRNKLSEIIGCYIFRTSFGKQFSDINDYKAAGCYTCT